MRTLPLALCLALVAGSAQAASTVTMSFLATGFGDVGPFAGTLSYDANAPDLHEIPMVLTFEEPVLGEQHFIGPVDWVSHTGLYGSLREFSPPRGAGEWDAVVRAPSERFRGGWEMAFESMTDSLPIDPSEIRRSAWLILYRSSDPDGYYSQEQFYLVTFVPEPSSALLLAMGLVVMGLRREAAR